jgi:hypothetical protein
MTGASQTGAVEAIAEAWSRTRGAGTARIMWLRGPRDVALPPQPPTLKSTGLLFPLLRLARWFVRNEAAARDAEGVIDFTRRRYMIDFGGYAVLDADGRQWDGASGRRLVTLPAEKSRGMVPLWLPDLLDGVRAATEVGVETVRGACCRHFQADIDPSHASSVLSDDDWPTDSIERPVDVWIDDAQIRRISGWAQARVQTLELWDFGLSLEELDWARLPVFRTDA